MTQTDDAAILARINAVPLTAEDLYALAEVGAAYHRDHPDDEADGTTGMMLAAMQVRGRGGDVASASAKAFALWARMSALAKLKDDLVGWTMLGIDGEGLWVQEAVYAAAAVHPLEQDGDEWVFDRASFLERVLALAEPETRS